MIHTYAQVLPPMLIGAGILFALYALATIIDAALDSDGRKFRA